MPANALKPAERIRFAAPPPSADQTRAIERQNKVRHHVFCALRFASRQTGDLGVVSVRYYGGSRGHRWRRIHPIGPRANKPTMLTVRDADADNKLKAFAISRLMAARLVARSDSARDALLKFASHNPDVEVRVDYRPTADDAGEPCWRRVRPVCADASDEGVLCAYDVDDDERACRLRFDQMREVQLVVGEAGEDEQD